MIHLFDFFLGVLFGMAGLYIIAVVWGAKIWSWLESHEPE